MIKVYTQFDRPKTESTPEGTRYLNVYQERIGKDGQLTLEKTGETCVYDMIQSHLEETKIENILHAVAMGDLNALNQREIFYADTTTMPKTLMELQNIVVKAKEEFETFPLEVRELFNNSCEQYVSEMGTESFLEKLAPYNKKISEIKEAGNLKEYQKKVAEQAKFEKDVAIAKGGTEE